MKRADIASSIFLFIVSWIMVADLFFHPGRSITFDGHIHITTIAQFYNALRDSELPVAWAAGFANYGYPLGLIAHQTPAYLGAFFQIFAHNPVLAFNITMLSAATLSTLFLYIFLRQYFQPLSACVGALLFHFAPYRILNIYARGALPEMMGSVFIPLILIGIHALVVQKKSWGFAVTLLGTTLLLLTHPMMLVIGSVVIIPYTLYLLLPFQKHMADILKLVAAACIGSLITSYYLLPLFFEMKYLTYGQIEQKFRGPDTFLSLPELLTERWEYFGAAHPGPRPESFTLGAIEVIVLFVALMLFIFHKQQVKTKQQILPWLLTGVLALFLVLPISNTLYTSIPVFGNLQFAWRLVGALIFVPAFCLAWLLEHTKHRWLAIVLIVFIGVIRIPQLYGKNFMEYDTKHYNFIPANLHTTNMNTIWMGDSRQYPEKTKQSNVISGQATVETNSIKNSSRTYLIDAQDETRLVDYTFYFPGWKVYVDNQPTEIQFQDPQYRGVITYSVPAGKHTVRVVYEDTKIRLFSKLLSLAGLFMALLAIIVIHNQTRLHIYVLDIINKNKSR